MKWKIIDASGYCHYDNFTWQDNKWHKIKGKLVMYKNGFHCSGLLLNELNFVPHDVICLVESKGRGVSDISTECWSQMRIVSMWRWTIQDSVNLAAYVISLAVPSTKFYPAIVRWVDETNKRPEELKRKAAMRAVSWSCASAGVKGYYKRRYQIEKWLVKYLTKGER